MLADSGTTIIYVLMHFDEDLHAEQAPNYGKEEEVQLFLDYTRMIVSHFKGRIPYYEILNEPLVYVEVEDYINLIHRMIPVIHEADPEAKIVVGGATALRHDVFPRLSIRCPPIRRHAPCRQHLVFTQCMGMSPQYDETREYYYNYPALVQEIKDVATAHGFNGEFVASEMVWRTPAIPTLDEQPSEYTDSVAAKYTARAIVINLGMDVVAGTTEATVLPIVSDTVRNLGNVMAGARAMDLPGILQSDSTYIKSYAFSLLNGD